MRPALLVLFDVDGTLLMEDAYAHGRAMTRAMREVWRVELPDDVVQRIEPWGKTDVSIARESLATAGVGDAAFERGMSLRGHGSPDAPTRRRAIGTRSPRSSAFASDRFRADVLGGATLVVADVDDMVATLERMAASG